MSPPSPPRPQQRAAPAPAATASAAPPAVPVPAEGLEVAGKVRLERRLTQGAMGSVWVARHLALDTRVAVKFMLDVPGLDESGASAEARIAAVRGRFEREAKAAALIRSVNVVQILDYGVDRGLPYIVMELLEGEDLATRIRSAAPLTPRDTNRILQPIARALQRAHDHGIVHRDFKPQNVFLAVEGDQEIPKILDFGVAKSLGVTVLSDEATTEGTVVGTPAYMSPEQAMGTTQIDHRSDLWSLGVVLYRAVTGTKLFQAKSMLEGVVQVCTAPIPLASEANPELGTALDAFFTRALSRDVEGRFQSAKELAAAFEAAADPRARSSLAPAAATATPSPPAVAGAAAAEADPTGAGAAASAAGDGASATVSPATTDARPAPAAAGRRRVALAAGAAVLLLGGVLVAWPSPEVPASPAAPVVAAPPPATATPEAAPLAAASAVAEAAPAVPAADPAPASSAPKRRRVIGGVAPAAAPPPPAPAPTGRRKRDLGY